MSPPICAAAVLYSRLQSGDIFYLKQILGWRAGVGGGRLECHTKAAQKGKSAHPDQKTICFLKGGIWNIGCVGRSERGTQKKYFTWINAHIQNKISWFDSSFKAHYKERQHSQESIALPSGQMLRGQDGQACGLVWWQLSSVVPASITGSWWSIAPMPSVHFKPDCHDLNGFQLVKSSLICRTWISSPSNNPVA